MPIPLIVCGVAALGAGFAGGAVARQPEINKLRSQVEILQEEIRKLKKEVARLQNLVEEQNRQINTLIMKYHTMKGINFIQKAKSKNRAKGAVMYTYCLKEYLEIKNNILTKEYNMTDDDNAFITAFEQILEGKIGNTLEDKAKKQYIKVYIRKKYGDRIDRLEECNLSYVMNRIGVKY